MIKEWEKKLLIASFVMILLAAGILLANRRENHSPGKDNLPVELHPIREAGGWGYEILVDKKPFIRQDDIPAIATQKHFISEKEALLAGRLAMEKLVHKKIPFVSKAELDSLGVHY
jgi:hypothetical protein